MHKLDIAIGLLYLPVCFIIGYTTANLKLCQMLCTHPPFPPPPKEEQWRDGVGVENYAMSGSGCGVWVLYMCFLDNPLINLLCLKRKEAMNYGKLTLQNRI